MSDSLWDEKRAQRYLRLYGDPMQKEGSQSLLCSDVAKLIEGDSVFDIGCGMGHLKPWLPEGCTYVGLDYSPTMLRYLEEFFPGTPTIQADATMDSEELKGLLRENGLPTSYDTTSSVSLMIHLAEDNQVRGLIGNLWSLCTRKMIYGVETRGDSVVKRKDGIHIRNMTVSSVKKITSYMIGSCRLNWTHQQMTYGQQFVIRPSQLHPLGHTAPRMIQRTTIFWVLK